jgi:hypothetical protein
MVGVMPRFLAAADLGRYAAQVTDGSISSTLKQLKNFLKLRTVLNQCL